MILLGWGYHLRGQSGECVRSGCHHVIQYVGRTFRTFDFELTTPAIRGKKRCGIHSGLSTGAPKGNKNALKHGKYTEKAIAERRYIWELISDCIRLTDEMWRCKIRTCH